MTPLSKAYALFGKQAAEYEQLVEVLPDRRCAFGHCANDLAKMRAVSSALARVATLETARSARLTFL